MRKSSFQLGAVVAGALALAGCGGGGGGGAALPTADNILPAEYSATGPGLGGIQDHFELGGTWRVNLDGQVQTTLGGTVALANALIYDTVNDEWAVNINGANFVLGFNAIDSVYESSGCITLVNNCVVFGASGGDPLVTEYGAFGAVGYVDATTLTFVVAHAGLKTPDMPTIGTGTFAGTFEGVVIYTDTNPDPDIGGMYIDALIGSADIFADFGAGDLTFASSGVGEFPGSTYNLNGSATIAGNTYADTGTVTGFYHDNDSLNNPSLQLDATGAGSTLSGAFYGPAAVQTAGVVYATSAPGDPAGEIAGGFWATQ